MKRFIVVMSILLVLFSATAFAAADMTITSTGLNFEVEPGDDNIDLTFKIQNSGDEQLTNIQLSHNLDLTDSDDEEFEFLISPASNANLGVGEEFTVTVTVDNVDRDFDLGQVDGTITITSDQFNTTLPVTVDVQPLFCDYGEVGNDLEIDIKEPDGSEYLPGEKIEVEIQVENAGNEDNRDVRVEVVIYNLDSNEALKSYKSSSKDIDSDETETFTFDFTIPYDDVSPGDEIVLYAIAYDDDHEDEECVSAEEDINLEEEEDHLIVTSIEMIPSAATCGSTVEVSVDVQNIGTDDQESAYVSVSSSLLGISESGSKFDIDEMGDSDDDYTDRVFFTVPENAEAGTYEMRVYAHYSGDKSYQTFDFTVLECNPEPEVSVAQVYEVPSNTASTGTNQVTGGVVSDKNIFDLDADDFAIPLWALIVVIALLVILIALVLVALLK